MTTPSGDAPGDHGDAFVYPTSGIAEGHARVPRWLIAVILALFGFFGWYVATQWGAQSSTAQVRK